MGKDTLGEDFQKKNTTSTNKRTRPSKGPQRDADVLENLRSSVRQKRKAQNAGLFKQVLGRPKILMIKKDLGSGPSKKPTASVTERNVDLVKKSDGFFEVHVAYSHCSEIADGCGLRMQDVIKNIEEDNLQIMTTPNLEQSEEQEAELDKTQEENEETSEQEVEGSDPESEAETQSDRD